MPFSTRGYHENLSGDRGEYMKMYNYKILRNNRVAHWLIFDRASSSRDSNWTPLNTRLVSWRQLVCSPHWLGSQVPVTCVEILSLCSLRNCCSQQLEINPRAEQATIGSRRDQALNLDMALNKHIPPKNYIIHGN